MNTIILLIPDVKATLLTREQSVAILEQMGIEVQKDEAPVKAWARAVQVANGLPPTLPVAKHIRDAIFASEDATRFFWALVG